MLIKYIHNIIIMNRIFFKGAISEAGLKCSSYNFGFFSNRKKKFTFTVNGYIKIENKIFIRINQIFLKLKV